MGGETNRIVTSILANPVQASEAHQLVAFVCDAHHGAMYLQQSFTVDERTKANLVAPRGNIITTVGDPSSVAQYLPPTIHMDVTPPWHLQRRPRRACALWLLAYESLPNGEPSSSCTTQFSPLLNPSSSLTLATATSRSYIPTYPLVKRFPSPQHVLLFA